MSTDAVPGLVVGTGDFVYDVVQPWGTLPDDWTLGLVSHVAVDSKDRVYFYQPRKDPPVLVFDREGRFLRGWGSQRFRDAHGIFVGPEDHLYLCNRDEHEVLKVTPEGASCWQLGHRGRPAAAGAVQSPGRRGRVIGRRDLRRRRLRQLGGASVLGRGQHLGSWGAPGSARAVHHAARHLGRSGGIGCSSPTGRTIGCSSSALRRLLRGVARPLSPHGHLRRRRRHGVRDGSDPRISMYSSEGRLLARRPVTWEPTASGATRAATSTSPRSSSIR